MRSWAGTPTGLEPEWWIVAKAIASSVTRWMTKAIVREMRAFPAVQGGSRRTPGARSVVKGGLVRSVMQLKDEA